ncbi:MULTISPECIES: 23S rRNA (uridine(2552)-2'-O)-methyltransferase RlmE [Thiorhodovibrio]|uniref:23S rRNA (uridine(2552)-2'-O)-methyltransferase RlmE n=1 Tax=Thiorhodovibrio TaxID=61593 RepID=UPI001911C627|nr:23S rRNA (uridine(2552)-2'-O)-methyltransferase RlmE [Thiorhodovibrio litoralis]MBK5967456.1 23S rRNA (uridine(2552)-2'-O)-methyltransferase [Thiorhodovibrio winogradskyi]WPL12582.1 Ribosomal RNA large subunit methyltransferase E [Thiorhodovibrio litoralis]
MGRSKSSQRWLARQRSDPYVKQAQAQGYRSRAAYKLLEIDAKDRLLRPGLRALDLGAAPGGWSQVLAARVGKRGQVIALDVLAMDPVPGVDFIEGDFTEDETLTRLCAVLGEASVDLVLSDMAPNVSGMRAVDQPRSIYLCELALDLSTRVLQSGGHLVMKAFHGEGFDQLVRDLRQCFERVASRKPEASRANSRETYLVAKGFRPACRKDRETG